MRIVPGHHPMDHEDPPAPADKNARGCRQGRCHDMQETERRPKLGGNARMKTAWKLFAAFAAAVVGGALIALPAEAQSYKAEYKVSTVLPAPFPWGLSAQKWA